MELNKNEQVKEVIQVENLVKDYGHGRGVFDVSFAVKEGEVFGFLGPNGAGKSTTIRHIMGFSKPQSGQTKVFGKESFSSYYEILDHVGYLPGEIALPDGLTGWQFIEMMAKLRKNKNSDMLNKLLGIFKLDPSVETKRMSLGDKRKLAIITAFMNDPKVLVLDEPTSGLDPVMQNEFINFIIEEKERGKTILLSSHIFSEVEATCDRIAIIKDGKIVSSVNTQDIKHNQNKVYKIDFASAEEREKFEKNCHFECEKSTETQEIVKVHDTKINELTALVAGYKITNFRQIKQTLQDYFMKFYKEDKDFGGQL